MQKTEHPAKYQSTIISKNDYRRINIYEKTFSINDLRDDIKVFCQNCGVEDYPSEKFLLEVLRKSGEEIFFCLKCWGEKFPVMSWVGVFCLIFLTEKGIVGMPEVIKAIHKVFGSPMDALRVVEGGLVLYSNSVKGEQMNLF